MAEVFIEGGQAHFVDPSSGQTALVPEAEAQDAADSGMVPLSREDVLSERFSPAGAFTKSALNALTFGGSNLVRRGLMGTPARDIQQEQEFNPLASQAGDIAGSVGSLVLPGVGLAGAAGRAGASAARSGSALSKGLGLVSEGAALGAGQQVAEASTEDSVSVGDLAGRIAGGAVKGAVLSGVLGAGTSGLSKLVSTSAKSATVPGIAQTASKASKVRNAIGIGFSALSLKTGGILGLVGGASKVAQAVGKAAIKASVPVSKAIGADPDFQDMVLSNASTDVRNEVASSYLHSADTVSRNIPELVSSDEDFMALSVSASGRRPTVSSGDIEEIKESASILPPEEHKEIAAGMFRVAGLDEQSVEVLSDIAAKKVQMIQDAPTGNPMADESFKKLMTAIRSPGSISRRVSSAEVTDEDLRVSKTLYPTVMKELSEFSGFALSNKSLREGMSTRQVIAMQKIAGGTHRKRLQNLVDNIRKGFAGSQEKVQGGGSGQLSMANNLTSLQRAQSPGSKA